MNALNMQAIIGLFKPDVYSSSKMSVLETDGFNDSVRESKRERGGGVMVIEKRKTDG